MNLIDRLDQPIRVVVEPKKLTENEGMAGVAGIVVGFAVIIFTLLMVCMSNGNLGH